MSSEAIGRRTLLGGVAMLTRPGVSGAAASLPRVVIRTDHGAITVELEVRRAPITAANFLRYVDAMKYDGGAFYRSTRPARASGTSTIVGGPNPRTHPYPPIAHESTTMTGLRHTTGTISIGRFAPGSATADFFICASPEPYLDAHPGAKGDNLGFAAFGQVVQGLAVVRRILGLPTDAKSPFIDQKGQWLNPPVSIVGMRRLG